MTARGEVPDFVLAPPTGPYRSLNPATKFTIAICEAIMALAVRGWTWPLAVIALSLVAAMAAGVARRTLPLVLASLPLMVSILLVNTFFFPGAHDTIVEIGPLHPTWTGLAAAVQATLRVIAFAFSVVVLLLTTEADHLLADLERRGLSRRATFIVGATLRAIPGTAARAAEITEAQRARGLDTEGSVWRRARGVVPLAGPLVLGTVAEVEERTLALEARGFSAPGRRTVIRHFPDSGRQAAARWLALAATVGLVAASVAGLLGWLP